MDKKKIEEDKKKVKKDDKYKAPKYTEEQEAALYGGDK